MGEGEGLKTDKTSDIICGWPLSGILNFKALVENFIDKSKKLGFKSGKD